MDVFKSLSPIFLEFDAYDLLYKICEILCSFIVNEAGDEGFLVFCLYHLSSLYNSFSECALPDITNVVIYSLSNPKANELYKTCLDFVDSPVFSKFSFDLNQTNLYTLSAILRAFPQSCSVDLFLILLQIADPIILENAKRIFKQALKIPIPEFYLIGLPICEISVKSFVIWTKYVPEEILMSNIESILQLFSHNFHIIDGIYHLINRLPKSLKPYSVDLANLLLSYLSEDFVQVVRCLSKLSPILDPQFLMNLVNNIILMINPSNIIFVCPDLMEIGKQIGISFFNFAETICNLLLNESQTIFQQFSSSPIINNEDQQTIIALIHSMNCSLHIFHTIIKNPEFYYTFGIVWAGHPGYGSLRCSGLKLLHQVLIHFPSCFQIVFQFVSHRIEHETSFESVSELLSIILTLYELSDISDFIFERLPKFCINVSLYAASVSHDNIIEMLSGFSGLLVKLHHNFTTKFIDFFFDNIDSFLFLFDSQNDQIVSFYLQSITQIILFPEEYRFNELLTHIIQVFSLSLKKSKLTIFRTAIICIGNVFQQFRISEEDALNLITLILEAPKKRSSFYSYLVVNALLVLMKFLSSNEVCVIEFILSLFPIGEKFDSFNFTFSNLLDVANECFSFPETSDLGNQVVKALATELQSQQIDQNLVLYFSEHFQDNPNFQLFLPLFGDYV